MKFCLHANRRILAVIGTTCLCVCSRTDLYQKALEYERHGLFDKAHEAYAQALLAVAPTRPIPDRNQVTTLKPEEFLEQTQSLVNWFRTDLPTPDSLVRLSLDGLQRCSSQVRQVTFPTQPVPKPLTIGEYRDLWQKAFFPEFVPVPAIQDNLIHSSFSHPMPFLRVTARKSYAYDGLLIHVLSGRAVPISIYFEGSLYLPLPPGKYLLVVRAKTQFASGAVWYSPYSTIWFQVPESAVLYAFTLNTMVEREKK